MRRLGPRAALLAMGLACALGSSAHGFILDANAPDPWLTTASGSRAGNGAPATITWSIVPDGTAVTNEGGTTTSSSNLISFLNTTFGGNPAQHDLTLQPWFPILQSTFGRWSQLGGVTYVYEPHDDGVLHPSSDGQLGVRGDIRLGGVNIDGPSGILAFTYIPPGGSDIVVDTSDAAFFSDALSNSLHFRNTVMHELGHSFGLEHVVSSSNLLMEPFINTAFDGPQLDEVRAVQFFFGDLNEKSNGGAGNNTAAHATSLGTIASGGMKTVGAAANIAGQFISPSATDFVSISNANDVDFYSFAVSQPSLLKATLTPLGGIFDQAGENETPTTFDANARNNLALTILGTNGTTALGPSDVTPAGGIESLVNLKLATGGAYFARITGADDTIQLYQLALSVAALLPADFDENGVVNLADLTKWKAGYGTAAAATHMQGDANGDGRVDGDDFLAWQSELGGSSTFSAIAAVPEPASWSLAAVAILLARRFTGRRENA